MIPDTTPSKDSPFLKRRTSPSQLQLSLPNQLPWTSPTGVLDSRTAALMEKSPASLIRHLSKRTSSSGLTSLNSITLPPSEWDGFGDGDEDLEFVTEVDEQSQVDEDLEGLLNDIRVYHSRQIIHYKRLLNQSQSSASLQLHSLQQEVKLLRAQLDMEQNSTRQLKLAQSTRQLEHTISSSAANWNLEDLLSVGFDELKVTKAIKALKRNERLRLYVLFQLTSYIQLISRVSPLRMSIILDAMLPTDISEQIRLLEKYVKSAFDVVGLLPKELGARILRELSVVEVLKVSTVRCFLFFFNFLTDVHNAQVCKTWHALVHHPSLWRYHTLAITSSDPVPPTPPISPSGWEVLYKKLHHRESNFRHGLPQEISFLRGHTNFCTTVILKGEVFFWHPLADQLTELINCCFECIGKRLISGSYDETIRFWDIQTGKETKCLDVKKPVSCIDFLAEEGENFA